MSEGDREADMIEWGDALPSIAATIGVVAAVWIAEARRPRRGLDDRLVEPWWFEPHGSTDPRPEDASQEDRPRSER
ncbi:MAG: hypothetical protein ABR529_06805 [Actinomycetota bacterium]